MERSALTCSPPLPSGQHRQSCDEYRLAKVLPHIKEEFHYRVENRLMVQKIIHPRRDKTILDSLAYTSCKPFCRKKKTSRNQTSIGHRRKMAESGFIKRQLRPQTCQIQSRVLLYGPQLAEAGAGKQHCDKKQCSSTVQERLQASNDTPKCRWLLTDSNYLRESSVGKIVKNRQAAASKSSKQTTYTTNRCVRIENSVTLPCELQKNYGQREERTAMLDQYIRVPPANLKKLERRALHQHFHNKQNFLE